MNSFIFWLLIGEAIGNGFIIILNIIKSRYEIEKLKLDIKQLDSGRAPVIKKERRGISLNKIKEVNGKKNKLPDNHPDYFPKAIERAIREIERNLTKLPGRKKEPD